MIQGLHRIRQDLMKQIYDSRPLSDFPDDEITAYAMDNDIIVNPVPGPSPLNGNNLPRLGPDDLGLFQTREYYEEKWGHLKPLNEFSHEQIRIYMAAEGIEYHGLIGNTIYAGFRMQSGSKMEVSYEIRETNP